VVEGAQPGIFATAPDQLDAVANQGGKRNPAAQLVEKARRKGHPANSSPPVGKRRSFDPLPTRAREEVLLILPFEPRQTLAQE